MKNNLLMKLISVRIKGMFRSYGNNLPGKRKNKKGVIVLFGLLMIYLIAVFEVMFVMMYDSLSVFCTMELTWLYFALAGLLAAAVTIFLNVFTTQNQLYNAKDNELLLAMPIPPGLILMSRMAVLLATALGSVLLVMIPAVGVYLFRIGPLSAFQWVGILLSVFAAALTAQVITCILGLLLHMFLRKIKNKAIGSMIFMVVFLVLYFVIYAKVGTFLSYLTANGEEIAAAVKLWAAPFYALGMACNGSVFHMVLLITGAAILFGLAYWVLSATFIKSVQGKSSAHGQKKVSRNVKIFTQNTPLHAVYRKELRKFLTSSVYITNYGIGLIMILGCAAAAVIFRGKIVEYMDIFGNMTPYMPLLIAAMLCFLNGMACLTAPSVSLEGKNLWVMRAMPISGRDILLGKLRLHLTLTGTCSTIAGLVMSVTMECSIVEIILVTIVSAAIAAVSGMLGLVYNLLLPNFKWLNEAVPCKQGMAAGLAIFSNFGIGLLGVLLYVILSKLTGGMDPAVFLGIITGILFLGGFTLYRLITGWGGRRYESFQC